MAIRVVKQLESADRQTITCPYWVDDDAGGTVTITAAQLAAMNQFTTDYGFAPTDWPAQRRSDGVVIVTPVYTPSETAQSDPPAAVPLGGYAVPKVDYEFFFQAKAPKLIKHGLAHVYHTANAPPFGSKINVIQEGGTYKTEGVTLSVPPATHRLRYVAPNASITGAYQNIVQDLCGCVNSSVFRGRAIGEVMLVSVTGAKRAEADWELVFEFASGVLSANPTTIDGVSFAHAIRPFDYPWVFNWMRPVTYLGNTIIVPSGVYGYVEQVWPYKDLNALSLPA